MKIAFLSYQADALDIAFRMALEGNQVTAYIENEPDKDCFDGIIPKAKTWQEAVKGKDLIVFDDNKLSYIWEKCNKDIPCFGGSTFADELENNRKFAHQIMNKAGIEPIESKSYRSYGDVIKHLKEHNDQAHVVKPQGKEIKSHHIIVGNDPDNSDSIDQVERLRDQNVPFDSIEVEEKKRGVEVGLTTACNGMRQIGPVLMNFEHKRSHDGEMGYLTGEQGTLVRYLEDNDLPIYKETLAKVLPILWDMDYRGYIDLNLIVGSDKDGPFKAPLEFTPRLGKPLIFIQDELHITPWSELFYACATGRECEVKVRYDWAVGVNLCAFGYPFREMEHVSNGLVIKGLSEQNLDHIHPIEVKINERGKFVSCQGVGEILCATGRGESILRAKDRAYANLSSIKMPNSFHRKDISDKISPWTLEDMEILPMEEGSVA